mmetsp:Transcript_69373/g.185062  ORF Transcript_69373/g.185062 Transcript_69373/m.185062 type:complete len:255 (+) Transcript_69373:345-1109(+)
MNVPSTALLTPDASVPSTKTSPGCMRASADTRGCFLPPFRPTTNHARPASNGIPKPRPRPRPTPSFHPLSSVADGLHSDEFTSTTTHASPGRGTTSQLVTPPQFTFAGQLHAVLAAAPSSEYRHSVPTAHADARRLDKGSPDSFTCTPDTDTGCTTRKVVTADLTGTLLAPADARDVPSAMANLSGYFSPTTVSSITPGTATRGTTAVHAAPAAPPASATALPKAVAAVSTEISMGTNGLAARVPANVALPAAE